MTDAPALQVSGLCKSFGGVVAVDDLSFTLPKGSLLAMIGPNGAGKSTSFNMLNGQLRPDRGSVRLDGREIAGLPPRRVARLGVGRTFQITATFPSLSVGENVAVALLSHNRRCGRLFGNAGRAHRSEVEALLARVGMTEQIDRPCGELAYGDLKRVELAVALANDPGVLLMDEPTAGMAPRERGELMALTAGIVRESHLSVLFTEHDMDVVFAHADAIIVLDRGRLVASGSPAEVRADPHVQEIYLGAAHG